jgi:hypothetical protein
MTDLPDAFDGVERFINAADEIDPDEWDVFSNGVNQNVIDGIVRPEGGETLIQRNHQGRPYIYPLGPDGEPLLHKDKCTYTRVTTFVDCLDDKSAIHQWEKRELIVFLTTRRGEDFLLEASSYHPMSPTYKKDMRNLIDRALDAAGAKDKARKGTAVHALSEQHDMGLPVTPHWKYEKHLEVYKNLTQHFEMVQIEQFVVNDEYETGGTPDRVIRYWPCEVIVNKETGERCGRDHYIEDLKTGRVDFYTEGTIAMQLAMYAHSKCYDIATGKRFDPPPLCPHKGIVVHIPAQEPDPEPLSSTRWINIAKGWRRIALAKAVREARADKSGLARPFTPMVNVHYLLRLADSQRTLRAIHEEHSGIWTPGLAERMEKRMEELA